MNSRTAAMLDEATDMHAREARKDARSSPRALKVEAAKRREFTAGLLNATARPPRQARH